MAIGFVLIKVEAQQELTIVQAIQEVENVSEVHPLFGEFDILVKIEVDDFYTHGQIVIREIRSIPGVLDTQTHPGIKL